LDCALNGALSLFFCSVSAIRASGMQELIRRPDTINVVLPTPSNEGCGVENLFDLVSEIVFVDAHARSLQLLSLTLTPAVFRHYLSMRSETNALFFFVLTHFEQASNIAPLRPLISTWSEQPTTMPKSSSQGVKHED
jgi:hypothetical protein